MKKRILILILVLILIAAVFFGVRALYFRYMTNIEKMLYPLPETYIPVIEKYSKEYGVPIGLLCGVIKTESSFQPDAVSRAGAMGIMQITEETFNWLKFKSGEEYGTEKLFDYEINIRLGTYFLSLLYEEYENWDTTLAAYNAGRGRVNGWLKDPEYSKDGVLVNIPFPETANYVVKVKKAAEAYDRLYFAGSQTE